MQFVRVAEELSVQEIPPPFPQLGLLENVQFVSVAEEMLQNIAAALLISEKVQSVSVVAENQQSIP